MALVTVEELKLVLGTGDLYADAVLEEVIEATDNVILPLLKLNRAAIVAVELKSNVAKYYTQRPHSYSVGQSLILDKIGTPFNGTKTIASIPTPNTFTVAITNADIKIFNLIPSGTALLASQATYYETGFPEVKEAALMVCVDIWNARQSAFGQAQAVDFQPGPYKMGRSIYNRVAGLLANHRDPRGMIG
jgi:hypothetical protein